MNYRETVNYLFSRLPAFTRIGKAAYKANLDNIIALCDALGNPEMNGKFIHIAGTNGKGSTSHFIASILQEAGYKTGLFTSPHLKDFRERIRVNGKPIPRKAVIKFTEEIKDQFEQLNPSFFEMTMAMAFEHFKSQKTDISVIETGLGGRLDSSNVIDPEISIITNISKDHMDLLGNTLEKIAGEKAGIIKKSRPVIISEHALETDAVFIAKAKEKSSEIHFAEDLLEWNNVTTIFEGASPLLHLKGNLQWAGKTSRKVSVQTPLTGNYQQKNLKAVIVAMQQLRELGWEISDTAIQKGILNALANTGLRGRWDILGEKPLIIADTAHNEAGVALVMEQLKELSFKHLHIVWGMVGDKEVSAILELLPKDAIYYFCKPAIARGMDDKKLQELAKSMDLKGRSYSGVKAALKAAKSAATPLDYIFIGGSTFVVAEVI